MTGGRGVRASPILVRWGDRKEAVPLAAGASKTLSAPALSKQAR